jgi:hypothetical protein
MRTGASFLISIAAAATVLAAGCGAAATPTAAPTAAATPTTAPSADPTGDAVVTGTGANSQTDPGTVTTVGDVTQVRGETITGVSTTNDPRVSGTATIPLNVDAYGAVGPEWGTFRLPVGDGAWAGTVAGGGWDGGNGSVVDAWLVGSGAYEGLAYYFNGLSSGSTGDIQGAIVPGSPPPAPRPSAAPAPGAPVGATHVRGTESVDLTTPYTQHKVGGVMQYRGGVATVTAAMDDPRVTGTGTFAFSLDAFTVAATEWGPYRLENARGAWEGSCAGSSWDDGNRANGSCWLVGSGDYAGYTYYRWYRWIPGDVTVEGIVFAGPPPSP